MTRGATECRSRAVRTGLARAPTSCVPASTPWHHRRLPPGQGAGRRDASAALPGRGEARRAPDRRDHGHQPGGPHRSQGQVGRHLRRPAAERRPQVQAARGRRVHQGHAREACAHLTLAPTLTLTLTRSRFSTCRSLRSWSTRPSSTRSRSKRPAACSACWTGGCPAAAVVGSIATSGFAYVRVPDTSRYSGDIVP